MSVNRISRATRSRGRAVLSVERLGDRVMPSAGAVSPGAVAVAARAELINPVSAPQRTDAETVKSPAAAGLLSIVAPPWEQGRLSPPSAAPGRVDPFGSKPGATGEG